MRRRVYREEGRDKGLIMPYHNILLEIGTEEIPARFIPASLKYVRESAERLLNENRIQFDNIVVYGTPRRMALIVSGVNELQGDITIEASGPPRDKAFDIDGRPTKAAEGFARVQGVDISSLKVKATDKGEYVYVERHEKGKMTRDILPYILTALIESITFPKSMRWNAAGVRFARPVRWITAVFGEEPLFIKFAGMESGGITYGHHFMRPDPIGIRNVNDYTDKLENNFVIVDQEKRKRIIEEQIHNIAREKGGRVIPDGELLEEIIYLTEYPVAVCGKFDDDFLSLPKDVLITVMKEHQRCFSLEDERGNLLPYFIGVSNTAPGDLDVVRKGYERVLRARLNDARFFFDADIKKGLEEHAERLRQVIFMGKLGTMWEKVRRVKEVCGSLCLLLGCSDIKPLTDRAAELSKADLMTEMVGEFPELQGIMGREYAIRQGEPDEVSDAIYEQYLPRFSGDSLPSTRTGRALAIADKIDNITGCFGIGNIPTGSNDPYALRRQALGILNVLITGRYFASLKDIIGASLTAYQERIGRDRHGVITEGVLEFFKERLGALLVNEGYRYDCVRAVLSTDIDDPYDSFLRISGLDRFRHGAGFEPLIISFKRVINIIPPGYNGAVNKELFKETEEEGLYNVYTVIKDKVLNANSVHDYERSFGYIAEIKPSVDLFFDRVLVMDKDIRLRNNRFSLLNNLKGLFVTLADFSQIVVEGQARN